MHSRPALLLAFALGVSACATSRPPVPLSPAEGQLLASYLLALNQANPTDPAIDERDPSLQARFVPPVELRRIQPSLPASARGPASEGKVLLAGVVERDGSVSSVRVLSSSGSRDFAASSVEAVRQWQYRPATLDGAPVRLFIHFTTSYRSY